MTLRSDHRDYAVEVLKAQERSLNSAGFGDGEEAYGLRKVLNYLDNAIVYQVSDSPAKKVVVTLTCGHSFVNEDNVVPMIKQTVSCGPCKQESPFANREEWVHVSRVDRVDAVNVPSIVKQPEPLRLAG